MKQQHINKLADLISKEKSSFRMGSKGEFRLGGSTFSVGTFELVVHYEDKEVSCSGYMGKQYITMSQVNNSEVDPSNPSFKVKVTRKNGAFIKNDVHFKNTEYELIKFFENWVAEVELENKV